MRNLKRVLALGMALVLTLGLMVTASAATAGTSYADDAAIASVNDEAVQVLTALGIYQGDGKNFNPGDEITRSEVAALAYRIMTADVEDNDIERYQTWAKFDDVKSGWYVGYINYVANAGILDGDGQGNFYPDAKITGYQLLKIVLCAIGYGQNGEYVGADWDKRTSSKANELGLLDGVNVDLGKPISRATVAQILFNGMTKALMVDYFLGYYWPMNIYTGAVITGWSDDQIQGGAAAGADKGAYVATLGFKQFGLLAANDDATTTLGYLGDRDTAEPDTKYGEPVGYWYIDGDKDAIYDTTDFVADKTAKDTIKVRFNPVATFTTAVTEKALYAAAKLKTTATKVDYIDFLAIDGVDQTDVEIGEKKDDVVEGTGKGVVTEVFEADGLDFVVIKNTYVNKVTQNLTVKTNGDIDKDMELENGGAVNATKADIAALKDIKKDTVVIYNKYDDNGLVIDLATIHAAPEYKVTVTNTYDKTMEGNADDTKNESYFLAGKKYEYNALYATDADITENGILNRDADGFNKKQIVYTDDNGYVVLAKDQRAASYSYGYVVLTKAAYNNYELDNVHYVKFTGYDADGKAITMNGGIDTFVYADAGVANAVATGVESETAAFEKGIYFFQYDAELGLYMLETASQHAKFQEIVPADVTDTDDNGTTVIFNGKADALSSDAIVDDDTVYVIVKYNDKGGITGYTVKTGFKTTGDLYDHDQKTAEGDDWNAMLKNVEWNVSYVNIDAADEKGAATIDLVYIEGATAEDDNDGYEVKDDGFILLDIVPEDKVTEYDLHTVIVNGKITTMKFWPDFVADKGMTAGTYYEVDQYRKGYVYSLTDEVVEPVALKYASKGSMDAGENVWADENAESDYLTLNDKCVVYEVDVVKGTCAAAKDITKIDTESEATAIIAARDDYGFATVIYIVDLGV